MKKIICIILAFVIVAACGCTAKGPEPKTTEAPAAEKNGDIVILFTGDVHCGFDQGFGYAGLYAIREHLLAEGNEVILVDDGDSIQGEPVGSMTKGETPIKLMNKMGYSVAIPGNHEFDYGIDRFLSLAESADFDYVSCNFNHKGELIFKPYVIRELAGKKIAFVGVTTPRTFATSSPKYFKDESGEFVYGFMGEATGVELFAAVQSAVDSARAEGADNVIVMGHMGNELENDRFTYADVIENTSGFDAFFDGHSHDADQVTVKNKNGEEVVRAACGTKLERVGWCRIAADGKISVGTYIWNNKEAAPDLLGIENEMSAAVSDAMDELDAKLSEVVAKAEAELVIYDHSIVNEEGKPLRIVRRSETNLGDLVADAYRAQAGTDIALVNGGGVRTDLPMGDITLRDILTVNPFGNSICVIEATGQQIMDALEWGARLLPGECGAFMQTSGLSYEIYSYIPSPCTADENGMLVSIEGERRVGNVLVGGQPIDPEGRYTVAGSGFVLLENGDGCTAFSGAKVITEFVSIDYQALTDYITDVLGGAIGEGYADPYGAGRIRIFDTAQ